MNNWGGKRENSGRKTDENKKKGFSVYLTEEEKYELDKINKNRSEAVKFLLENYLNLKK